MRGGRYEEYRLGPGVTVIAGSFPEGLPRGAANALGNKEDVTLEVRDVPLALAERMAQALPSAYEIIRKPSWRHALEAERKGLQSRLADIEAALSGLPPDEGEAPR
ncbi:hypothetical protein KRR26_36000 [Corallococcus sp. M34]|uniref:hypothetical protein n=1 Tax=Citreicoccus inhibens TaxID=2849499 RepID=UPI001C2277CC|nr:hypothetical protein [Citreicoccus inhibens]MBU8901012.1 hypothetical protein [Citreicoccus inhibens]